MHITRLVAATTAAAVLALTGVAASAAAAQAAPPAHATKATKPSKPAKPTKVDRGVARVVTAARVLDKGLAAVASSRRLQVLEVASADAIRANVAADRAAVAAVVAAVTAVTADPAQALAGYATLRTYRTSNYSVATGQVRSAESLGAYAAAIADRVAVEAPEQQAAYDEALVLIDAAHADALAVTATTSRADLDVISADLLAADQLLEQVSAALAV